MPNTEISTRT